MTGKMEIRREWGIVTRVGDVVRVVSKGFTYSIQQNEKDRCGLPLTPDQCVTFAPCQRKDGETRQWVAIAIREPHDAASQARVERTAKWQPRA